MFDELVRRPGVLEEARVRSNVAFLALHGGSLERGTAEIATAAADRAGASLYAIRQPEDLRWHIPSHLADLDALPKLRTVLEHVDVVVSLHGYGRPDLRDTLLLGGGNRELAAALAVRLREVLPGVARRRRPRGDPGQPPRRAPRQPREPHPTRRRAGRAATAHPGRRLRRRAGGADRRRSPRSGAAPRAGKREPARAGRRSQRDGHRVRARRRRVDVPTELGTVAALDAGTHVLLQRHGLDRTVTAAVRRVPRQSPRAAGARLRPGARHRVGRQPAVELGVGTFVAPDDFIALHLGVASTDDTVEQPDPGLRPRTGGAPCSTPGPRHSDVPVVDGGVYWQTIGPALRDAGRDPAHGRARRRGRDDDGVGVRAGAASSGSRYAAVCVVDNLANGSRRRR